MTPKQFEVVVIAGAILLFFLFISIPPGEPSNTGDPAVEQQLMQNIFQNSGVVQ
jgi:hypothetical protein